MDDDVCLSLGVNKAIMCTVEVFILDVLPHHTQLQAVNFTLGLMEFAGRVSILSIENCQWIHEELNFGRHVIH